MKWSTTTKKDSWGWVYGAYAALAISTVIVSFLRANLFFMATLKASSTLCNKASLGVIHSPLSFFTANPLGRILNRFSSDLSQVSTYK